MIAVEGDRRAPSHDYPCTSGADTELSGMAVNVLLTTVSLALVVDPLIVFVSGEP